MGLDMYLTARRYYFNNDADIPEVKDVPDGYRVKIVEVDVAYWRKANAIHDWFVQNVQDGEDNCQPYTASREELQSLVDTCKTVIADPEKAKDLLPTTDGVFFGGTDYGEYYFQCLHDTVDQIEKALSSFPDSWNFDYRASW
jgi:hypothetical protein